MMPGTVALVLSHTIASAPSSPNRISAASSVGSPVTGAGSSFQSPVWSTAPSGVRRIRALGSGTECVTLTNSTSNGPAVKRPDSGTSMISTRPARFFSNSFARSTEAVNGVA